MHAIFMHAHAHCACAVLSCMQYINDLYGLVLVIVLHHHALTVVYSLPMIALVACQTNFGEKTWTKICVNRGVYLYTC